MAHKVLLEVNVLWFCSLGIDPKPQGTASPTIPWTTGDYWGNLSPSPCCFHTAVMLTVLPKVQVHPKLLPLASRAGDTRAGMDTGKWVLRGPRVEAAQAAGGWDWSEHPAHYGCLLIERWSVSAEAMGRYSSKGKDRTNDVGKRRCDYES